jgi:two-component system KDP operon response regulator KdpE
MGTGALILIIDDEVQIRRMLRLTLEAHEYRTIDATTAQEGIQMAAAKHPDLIILDLGLPDNDGYNVLKNLREWTKTPVIVLTVKDTEEEKVKLLDAGANDYVTKPFGMQELLARVRVILRNMIPERSLKSLKSKNITLDLEQRVVKKNGYDVRVTPTEYALLRYLACNAGKVVTHNQIIRELWGSDIVPDPSYLRVYILQLRKKIEDDPANPEILITAPGIGYRFIII